MNIFAMVTTRHSNHYTNYALSTLIYNTKLQPDDEIILIDNDGTYPELPVNCRDRVQIRINENPRSFAANVNQALELARERKADVIFLNNDLIFSPGWFEPLTTRGAYLLSPLSNAEIQYSEGGLECKLGLNLEDYVGKETVFRDIVRRHRNRLQGYLKVLTLPFFAVKIPHAIYSVVGQLDESFGVGGGEDKDYCVRCYQRGFEIRFALNSYILHFQGKSTWRGAETREETAARDRFYSSRFKEKWGDGLFQLMIFNEVRQLPPHLQQAYEQRDFQKLIGALAP
jgi:O-antigen biosynthesis protein